MPVLNGESDIKAQGILVHTFGLGKSKIGISKEEADSCCAFHCVASSHVDNVVLA